MRAAALDLVVSVGVPLVVDDALYNCAVTLYGGRRRRSASQVVSAQLSRVLRAALVPAGGAKPVRPRRSHCSATTCRSAPTCWSVTEASRASCCTPKSARTCGCPCRRRRLAALSGATVLANLSASNVTSASGSTATTSSRCSSAKNLAVQLYSAAGFRRIDQRSRVGRPRHDRRPRRAACSDRTLRARPARSAVADVDLAALVEDRMRQTSFAHNAAAHAATLAARRRRSNRSTTPVRLHVYEHSAAPRRAPLPFVPTEPAQRDERCREIFQMTSTSLARRLQALARRRPQVHHRRIRRTRLDARAARRRARDGSAGSAAHRRHRRDHARVSARPTHLRRGVRSRSARSAAPSARSRSVTVSSEVFGADRPRPRGRGPDLRERAGVGAQVHAVLRRVAGEGASTSARAICPSSRSALRPTAAITCRTTASTPASRRR